MIHFGCQVEDKIIKSNKITMRCHFYKLWTCYGNFRKINI